MPRRGRTNLTSQTCFFVTTTTENHEHFFSGRELKARLLDIIMKSIRQHNAVLHGFVLMSNHFHLLLSLEGGGPELSRFMRDVKSISARILFPGHHGIWIRRFDNVALYSDEHFRTKLDYIHNNPVKAGLARNPSEYEFSSARQWLPPGSGDSTPRLRSQ